MPTIRQKKNSNSNSKKNKYVTGRVLPPGRRLMLPPQNDPLQGGCQVRMFLYMQFLLRWRKKILPGIWNPSQLKIFFFIKYFDNRVHLYTNGKVNQHRNQNFRPDGQHSIIYLILITLLKFNLKLSSYYSNSICVVTQ